MSKRTNELAKEEEKERIGQNELAQLAQFDAILRNLKKEFQHTQEKNQLFYLYIGQKYNLNEGKDSVNRLTGEIVRNDPALAGKGAESGSKPESGGS